MPIATYFSHSYRLEDQRLNKTFWAHFKSDFSFFVDPPSDITIHTHLERMMRRCGAFVAVFNRRRDVPKLHCSPFMLYEYGLAIQARIPKLLLIDNTINKRPFEKLAFYQADKGTLHIKVWYECYRCPKFANCDEIAMVRPLDLE